VRVRSKKKTENVAGNPLISQFDCRATPPGCICV
jgi:hypothetical protein